MANLIKWLPVMICLLLACSKDKDVSAPPVVNTVTLLDSLTQDSSFVRALPGTLILITGQNLQGVVTVAFNGQNAYFNPTYNTNTHLIITIPSNAPTEATAPDVPNTIHISTTHGDVSYSFVVDIPPPSISAVSNENALPGDSLIVYGASLWLINKVVFPGGRELTAFTSNEAGTRLAMVMPDFGDDTGRFSIDAKYGSTVFNAPLNDHHSGNVISNLTADGETGEMPVFNWAWWGANRSNDAAMFPGTRGYYLQNIFGGVGAKDGAWWNGNRSGNFNEITMFTPDVMTQVAANYALKFEINIKEPWTAGVNLLRMGDNYAYRFMPWSTAAGGKFDTKNTWQTITIPLSEFKNTADGIEGTGANAVTMGDLLKAGGVVAFGYRFITEATPVDLYNAAYDNFRIVKIRP